MFNFKKKIIKEVSSIDKMEDASFPVLPFPFNGVEVLCKVRCLNRVQLESVGELHLINLKAEYKPEDYKLQDTIDLVNYQEALIKETLIEPTFEEIQTKIYGLDNSVTERKQKLKDIRDLIEETTGEERKEFEKEADAIELFIGSLLPSDFLDAVCSWATGANRSDIKKVTRKMLLQATILAKNGNDNPADHLDGDFLDIHKDEINKSGWIVYNEYMEQKQLEKDGPLKGMKVTRGGAVGN